MSLGDRKVNRLRHCLRHPDDHFVRNKLWLAACRWQLLGSRRRRRRLGRRQRPARNPRERDRSARRAPAGKDASAQLLPTSLAKAAAVVNTSCDADDVDGRGSPPYSARERERLCIVGLAIVVLAIVVLAIVVFAAVGRAIVGVGRRAVIARAPDLTWRVMVVLMIVRMLIGLFAGSMQACSL